MTSFLPESGGPTPSAASYYELLNLGQEGLLDSAKLIDLVSRGLLPEEYLAQLTGGLTLEDLQAIEQEKARQYWEPIPYSGGYMDELRAMHPGAEYSGEVGSRYGARERASRQLMEEKLAEQAENISGAYGDISDINVDALNSYLSALGTHMQTMGQTTAGVPQSMLHTPSEAGLLTTMGPLAGAAMKFLFPGAGKAIGSTIAGGAKALGGGLMKALGLGGAPAATAAAGAPAAAGAAAPAISSISAMMAGGGAPSVAGAGGALTMPWEFSPAVLGETAGGGGAAAGGFLAPGSLGALGAGAAALAAVPAAILISKSLKKQKEERYEMRENRAMSALSQLSDKELEGWVRAQIAITTGAGSDPSVTPYMQSSNTLMRLFGKGKIAELAASRGWSGELEKYAPMWDSAQQIAKQREAQKAQERGEIRRAGYDTGYKGRDADYTVSDIVGGAARSVKGGPEAEIDWDTGEISLAEAEAWTPERVGALPLTKPEPRGRAAEIDPFEDPFEEYRKRGYQTGRAGALKQPERTVAGYTEYLEAMKRKAQRK